MKRYVPIILLLLPAFAPVLGQGQARYDKLIDEANRYFNNEQYHLALELYKEALETGENAIAVDYRLAECYRHTFDYAEAEPYYLKVLYTDPTNFPLSLYYYALMLKLNGNLSEAARQFDRFIVFHEHNSFLKEFAEQAVIEKAGCEMAQAELGMAVALKSELVAGNINSPYNDFAPAFRNSETVVITSSRVASNRTLIDERNGEAFTDNYYFEKTENAWKNNNQRQFQTTNSLYHDGTGSFTRTGGAYFFTICEERCRIYETHLEDDKWTRPTLLNEAINAANSESKQPAISPGGDTLYFASNRAGGYGGFDIWMSTKADGDEWQEPLNVGRMINTRANDLAPSIANDPSVLFFSSKGHPGYGGFDFFVATTVHSDTVVYNLGLPFNSVKDDCFITFNNREIFWSSNRDGGIGGFDVYAARQLSAPGLVAKLGRKNRNDSRSVVLTSRTARAENITLLASRNEETIDYNNLTYERKALVNSMVENELNNSGIKREDYMQVTQEEYDMLRRIADVRFRTLLLKQKYASTLLTEVVRPDKAGQAQSITGTLLSSRDGHPLASARVLLTNAYGDILKITSTNEQGQFRFTGVTEAGKLFLRLESASDGGAAAFVENLQMMGSDKKSDLYVENVYFDFDHYVIRPEACQVLTELAAFLKYNPGAQVEVYAFADDRGSSAYNFELTQKRGEAIVAFLAKKGVDETSLAIVPKGKQTIERAATEVQRQYNRRAEFYINGVRQTVAPSVKTYIVKKETYWDVIAKLTGIAEEKLRDLNGAETKVVKAHQPVRLPLNCKSISEEFFFVGI